jgi:predicted HD superfamily hydrolase involved in NAD metabolism
VEIAKSEYGITDDEILNAIKYHTVGKAGMTLLEKIIYIADMTEENRDFDGVDELRATVDKDLDETILKSITQQFKLQSERRSVIHPNIVYMWNDLIFK